MSSILRLSIFLKLPFWIFPVNFTTTFPQSLVNLPGIPWTLSLENWNLFWYPRHEGKGGSIPYLKWKVLICSLSVTFLNCWTISHLSHTNELTRNKTFFNLFAWYVLLFYLVFTIFFYIIFDAVPFINCSYFIYKYYFLIQIWNENQLFLKNICTHFSHQL